MQTRALVSVLALLIGGATFVSDASAQPALEVTLKTAPHGGNYAPRNIVAVWVEDAGGTFVKTIGRWAATRRQHLVAWTAKAGANDADAVSGATRANHTAALAATWDLKDRAGAEVPDGTYTLRMELADSNASTAGQNDQGTFTFTKSATPSNQVGLTSGGFTMVGINYTVPASPTCGDGTVDTGETCDPVGSCPTSCAAPADACLLNTLAGSAAACNAACVMSTITACADDDGCCPAACTDATDNDCAPGGGGGGDGSTVTGGCSTSGAPVGAGLALGLALGLIATRRRRR